MSKDKVVAIEGCVVPSVDPSRVRAVRARLISADEAGRLAELFRLLGDRTRTRLLFALLEAGELCVCDLAATVGVSETAVSHALRLLRAFGVVRARRDGRVMYYSLDDAHVRVLLDLSREHLRHGARGDERQAATDSPGRGTTGKARPHRGRARS